MVRKNDGLWKCMESQWNEEWMCFFKPGRTHHAWGQGH